MKGRLQKKAAALTLAVMLVTSGVPMQPVADMARELMIAASATTYVDGSHNGRCSNCTVGDVFEAGAELLNDTGSDIYLNFTDSPSNSLTLQSNNSIIKGTTFTIVYIDGNTWNLQTGETDCLTGIPGGDTVFAYNGSDHSLITSEGTTAE